MRLHAAQATKKANHRNGPIPLTKSSKKCSKRFKRTLSLLDVVALDLIL
jgi:hypothetical protein